jgi:hypothetical protein
MKSRSGYIALARPTTFTIAYALHVFVNWETKTGLFLSIPLKKAWATNNNRFCIIFFLDYTHSYLCVCFCLRGTGELQQLFYRLTDECITCTVTATKVVSYNSNDGCNHGP